MKATAILVAACVVSGAASAQDFSRPTSVDGRADTPLAVTVQGGEARCFSFTIATPRLFEFSASTDKKTCRTVDAELAVYRANAVDPTRFIAWEAEHAPNACVTIARRLDAGSYLICASGLAGFPSSFYVRRPQKAAGGTPANDTFVGATLLTKNTGTLKGLSLDGANHDYSPMPLGPCLNSSGDKGPDRVWSIDLSNGQELSVTLKPKQGAPHAYLIANPEHWWLSCVGEIVDTRDATVRITHTGGPQRYYIVVDELADAPADFELAWVRR